MSNDVKQNFELRISTLIERIKKIQKTENMDEAISDLSKYLCILISGYVEKVLVNKLVKYSEQRCAPQGVKFISLKLKNSTNYKMSKISELLDSFDCSWNEKLIKVKNYDEYEESINYIYQNRNKIAHGDTSGVVLNDLENHYFKIQNMFMEIDKILYKP